MRALIDAVCQQNLRLKPYLPDDQEQLRRHVTTFIDGTQNKDRRGLSDRLATNSSVFIAQALSRTPIGLSPALPTLSACAASGNL
jgi:hypothetical protein